MTAFHHSARLDALRGYAAQMVFFSHLIDAYVAPEPLIAHALGWSARAAVILFFCLSGFVITRSVMRHGTDGFAWLSFARRRIARIYPPYLLAIGVTYAAGFMLAQSRGFAPPDLPAELVRALVFLNGKRDVVTMLNGPLWSLRLEVICYAITGLLAVAWLGAGPRPIKGAAALGAVALAGAAVAALTFGLSSLCWFGFGALAALGRLPAPTRPMALAVAMFLMGLLATRVEGMGFGASDTIPAILIQIAVAASFAMVIATPGAEHRTFRAGGVLGQYSYTLYVVHYPLIALAKGLAAPAIAALIAIQAFAFAASRLVERPDFYVRLLGGSARQTLSGGTS